jgi:endonuclease/exonuclease/phosphatase family metal-dependent hydrolase
MMGGLEDGMRRATWGLALAAALAAAAAQPGFCERYGILTYNAGLLRVAGFDLVPGVCARERVVARKLATFAGQASPGIILLQEIWKNSTASAISRAFSAMGYSSVRPHGCSPICLGSGLLLLVREPLRVVQWTFTPFSRRSGLDGFARKGVLSAVVEDASTGRRFAVLGTHTIAVDTIDGVPKNETQLATYLAQAAALREALDRAGSGGLPAILTGDLNAGPGYVEEGYQVVAGAPGVLEAGEHLFPGSPLPTWDPANPLVRLGLFPNEPAAKIDHVFLRAGADAGWQVIDARRVLDTPVEGLAVKDKAAGNEVQAPLSDHYGFLVEVETVDAR